MIILDATWRPVYAPGNTPIAWYREIPTMYAVFDSKGRIERHDPGVLPLPYTNDMVSRYNDRYRAQVFTITELKETA